MLVLSSGRVVGVVILLLGVAVLLFAQNKPPLVSKQSSASSPAEQTPPGAPPLVQVPGAVPRVPPPAPAAPVAPPPPPAPEAGQAVPPAPPGGPLPPPAPVVSVDLSKAPLAVQTAGRARPYLSVSSSWATRGPRGEVDLKTALVYEGLAVAILHFDPQTGQVLPKGYHSWAFQQAVSAQDVAKRAQEILGNLEVLSGAEYREPEACWVVPLAYQGRIVAELRVSYDGTGIVPDIPATQEMQTYGK